MDTTDRAATLGDIVITHPAAAALFERLGMDYCCGGGDTLEHACDQRGLDVRTVSLMLEAPHTGPAPPHAALIDMADTSITQLCEHILVRRHGPLRVDLQRIGEMLNTVVRVHGDEHPELQALQDRFTRTRGDLEAHTRLEEDALFPACRALDAGLTTAFDEQLLAHLEDAHSDVGLALRELREAGGGYATDRALCGTHRALLESLLAFEHAMHQHVHEENNVLFPRVREQLVAMRS